VAVRHRHAAAHAGLPPAISSQHTSWEEELEAELGEDAHAKVHYAPLHSPAAAGRHSREPSRSGTGFLPPIGPGRGVMMMMPSPSPSPPSALLRSPTSPDSEAERSFSPVGQQQGQGGANAASVSASASAAAAAASGRPSDEVLISSTQPLRLHAPSRLNVSPPFVEPEAGESCLSVFTGTWNLHAKAFPSPDLLAAFIPPDEFDLYVIGTEECENSIETSFILTSKAKWVAALEALLDKKKYVQVAQQTLQAIHIIAFVRISLAAHVHHVEHACVATGIGDVVGNKGGVALGFDIANTSLLFINAHLAAHQHAVAQRNADYHKICLRMPLKEKKLLLSDPDPERRMALARVTDRFDRVFFMGDLNYRVAGNRRMVDAVVSKGMIEVLLAKDQLNQVRARGEAFRGFIEGDITFPPTYKFDNGTDTYDSSKKRRIPSYTDRILWKASDAIALLQYGSVDAIKTSDHRPVFATFKVKIVQRTNPDVKLKKTVRGTTSGSKACVVM
jgi:phosphatidylinositol-bisphosphatase